MGLRKKTFLYSIALAAIMTVFVIGYFVLMLPSLYVDYVMDSNLESVAKIQKGYMEDRTYDSLTVKNPSSVYTLEVPDTGDEIYVAGKFFKASVMIRNGELQEFLDYVRQKTNDGDWQEGIPEEFTSQWKSRLRDIFAGQEFISEDSPIEIRLEPKDVGQVYTGEYSRMHVISGDVIVYETGVSDGSYGYTTYVAMGRTQDAFIITVMPAMTPQMGEITPIVMGSLPMIVAVIFLVVLVSSGFFSGKIVNPIIRLAGYAESAEMADRFEIDEFGLDSRDEIGILGRNLYELYGKLRDNYEELERKNRMLEEENQRQEVFLRASSHQLKTPIAAALLLVEGMMNGVGRYKDTKAYLPEVKRQLLAMRKIVEDILYLNYHAENMQQEKVAVETLMEELVREYAVQAEDKGLQIAVEGEGLVLTDREMLRKIVDNLLSNAVQYTPERQRVVAVVSDRELCVTNYGVTIDENLLPNICEPFVSSDTNRKGRGLGLYVAAYYSRLMGYRLEIMNMHDGVCARIKFV